MGNGEEGKGRGDNVRWGKWEKEEKKVGRGESWVREHRNEAGGVDEHRRGQKGALRGKGETGLGRESGRRKKGKWEEDSVG